MLPEVIEHIQEEHIQTCYKHLLENIFRIAYRNAVNKTFPDIAQRAYQITLDNHYKILSAVEARNVELAQQLMADHFEGIRERIEMKIEESSE